MARKSANPPRRRQERYVSPRVKWAIFLSALGLIAAALVVTAFIKGWIVLPERPSDPVVIVPPVEEKEDTVIHLVAGGDVNVTDRVISCGGNTQDFSGVFLDVLPVLASGDLTLMNLEGNVCGEPYGSQLHSAPTQLLDALRSSGADVLQTANSHSLTNGLLGLRATNDAIRAAGMQPLGTYADAEDFQRQQGYLLYEIQGIRVALVAFTKGMDGRNLPAGMESCVNLLYEDYSSNYKTINEDGITQILKAVEKSEPDITIAMLHWGSEYNDQISSTQKSICNLMARLGVDAVIGTHSHHVQSMGFDPETGMFIAWSIGDLLGDAQHNNDFYSILLDLEITRSGKTGKTRITGFDYTPIYQYYPGDGSLRLLRIREAIAAYENNYIGRVPEDVYQSMKTALSRIEARVEP